MSFAFACEGWCAVEGPPRFPGRFNAWARSQIGQELAQHTVVGVLRLLCSRTNGPDYAPDDGQSGTDPKMLQLKNQCPLPNPASLRLAVPFRLTGLRSGSCARPVAICRNTAPSANSTP